MIKTFKYRIKDNSAKKTLRRHAYAVNQVWNYCAAHQRDTVRRYWAGENRKWASHFDLQKLCKGAGALLGIHQQSVGGVCKQFTEARRKCSTPGFRSSFGQKRALGWIPFEGQSRQVSGNTISYLGKKYRFWEGNRPLPENAKGGCFTEDSLGRWCVCFVVDVPGVPCVGNEAIGIDLGLKSLAVLSNGEKIEPGRFTKKYEEKGIAYEQ